MISQKLKNLLSDQKKPLGVRIKNYALVESIFILYLKNYFVKMSREIYFYKPIDFFPDFALYLDSTALGALSKQFYSEDMRDEYYAREAEIIEEMKLKRERKKYLL